MRRLARQRQHTCVPILLSFKIPLHKMATDQLQGTGDVWQKSVGYGDLNEKTHTWAVGVLETGRWPKPQMIAGSTADVIEVVQAEIDRIKQEKNTRWGQQSRRNGTVSTTIHKWKQLPNSYAMVPIQ